MIDHISIPVHDYRRSKEFYSRALAPLGYTLLMEFGEEAAGFGAAGNPDFWIATGDSREQHVHVAFQSQTREPVNAFYSAAMDAGGMDNGKPGLRSDYHPNYYAAFVKDPDGHNIEVVCHRPV